MVVGYFPHWCVYYGYDHGKAASSKNARYSSRRSGCEPLLQGCPCGCLPSDRVELSGLDRRSSGGDCPGHHHLYRPERNCRRDCGLYHYCSLHAAGRFPGGSVYRFPAGSPLSCGPGPCYPCGTAASLRRARGPGSNHFYRRILQAFWQCARRNYDYLVAPGSRRFY